MHNLCDYSFSSEQRSFTRFSGGCVPKKTLRTTNLAHQKHSIFQRNKVGFAQASFPHIHREDPYYKISLSKNFFSLANVSISTGTYDNSQIPKTVYS